VLAGERLPKRLSRHPKCEGTVEDHRNIALDARELIRQRVFDNPAGSAFRLPLAAGNAAEFLFSRFAACHGAHRGRATGFGKLWRHGRADAARVPAVW
jgi:hypothetical protein